MQIILLEFSDKSFMEDRPNGRCSKMEGSMTVTVLVWDMFHRGPDRSRGVGHAAMHVSGKYGTVYVSLWPAEHSLAAGLMSPAKVHFANGDRLSDGTPQWASKSLDGLNEQAIILWWSGIQRSPLVDYKNKKPSGIFKQRYSISKG
jgi:hypothetical protein